MPQLAARAKTTLFAGGRRSDVRWNGGRVWGGAAGKNHAFCRRPTEWCPL